MQKFIIFLILTTVFAVSCGSSKKAENNDADILPDEDMTDEDENYEDENYEDENEDEEAAVEPDEDENQEYNPCSDLHYTDGTVIYKGDGTFDCGCIENYFWNGKRCSTPCKCKGVANSNEECSATSMEEYSCGCVDGYFWDGKKCVDPCIKASCKDFEHSTGKCRGENAFFYTCGCVDGFYWWGTAKGCIETKPEPAQICTGAYKCYSTWEVLKCRQPGEEFYGQDTDYAAVGSCVPRNFAIDNSVENEPVIIDNNLKIEWMYKFSDSIYPWYNAVKYCEDIEYGGHNDWRLPSPQELMTYPPLSNADEELYLWSSKSVHGNDPYAWKINYPYKSVTIEPKTAMHNVSCVRGEPIDAPTSFKSIDTNLVMDYKNGFMWSTANHIREKMWNDAITECENAETGGFTDWRLPNINELSTLLNFEKSDPASDFPYPENIPVYFWSSTTLESNIEESPGITIYGSGEIKNLYKPGVTEDYEPNENRVVCVRNEFCKENYFWNGVDCVESPCSGDPCKDAEHSDEVCHIENVSTYSCGCVENYFWDGTRCINPCDSEPCKNHEHSNNKCEPRDKMRYTCGCEEGYYWWWGQNKGCIERKPDTANICTGQTKCYNREEEIDFPAEGEDFFGQDAYYADMGFCAPQNFSIDDSVENEKTVIDNNTGLEWLQTFSSYYENYCEDLVYGGHDDWRLPTILELQTIVDNGKTDPAIDTAYFPNTPSAYFMTSSWSNSLYTAGGPHDSWNMNSVREYWTVDFSIGVSRAYSSYNSAYVRCVRGERPAETAFDIFVGSNGKNADITFDSQGTLIWQAGTKSYGWQNALKYCEDLKLGGLSDWRLPNKNELIQYFPPCSVYQLDYWTGYDHSYYSDKYQWSSTSLHNNPLKAWMVQYKDCLGSVHLDSYRDKTDATYTRCVTDNPCSKGKIWNGETCVKENPCDPNPCNEQSYSTKTCIISIKETTGYFCECSENAFWSSDEKRCIRTCGGTNPCIYYSNSDQQCYEDEKGEFYCGCKEPYYWNAEYHDCSKKCETDPCADKENSDGHCSDDTEHGYVCGCIDGYLWLPFYDMCVENLCISDPCENIENSDGTCEINEYLGRKCGCIEGYTWNFSDGECR